MSTTTRSVRIPDETWGPARLVAIEAGCTMEELIDRILDDYVREGGVRALDTHYETPKRTIRVTPSKWRAASQVALASNETVSEVIRRGLETVAQQTRKDQPCPKTS